MQGLEKLPGISNYFLGNDPAQWQTSPLVDPRTREHRKVLLVAGAGKEVAAQLWDAAVAYADFVEKGLGNDPGLTAPWL